MTVDLGCKATKQTNKTNSLDPDQDQQNVGPDLDSNSLIVFLKEYFEKSQQTTTKA